MFSKLKGKKILCLAFLVSLVFSLTGCDGETAETQNQISSDKVAYNAADDIQEGREAVVYYVTSKGMYLYPERVVIEPQEGCLAEGVVKKLIEGPDHDIGKTPIPQNTKLNHLKVKDATAYADFSRDFLEIPYQLTLLNKLKIEAVVRTLCEFDDVDEVQILIDGKMHQDYRLPLKPPESFNALTQPLESSNRSLFITFYYSHESGGFLIPVTKEIKVDSGFNPTLENMCRLALQHLAKVDEELDHLNTTLPEDIKLKELYVKDKTVYVDVNRKILLKYDPEEINKHMVIRSIVNTLCSIPGIDNVQFLVDGKPMGVVVDGISLSKPIHPSNWIN